MSSIRMENVDMSYGEQSILKNFHLYIEESEFISVIGGSGSGKTTVLKLINGLLTPQHGDIYVEEQNINHMDGNELRRHIGYVIQSIGLFPHLTVRENIAYVLHLMKAKPCNIDQRIKELLDIMNLEDSLLTRYPDELSGGQRQRVGIARALAAKPKILLMDEPFSAVDEITRHSLQNEIIRIHKNLQLTVFFITHDIREALRLADRVLVMKDGRIEQFDSPGEIMKTPATAFVKQLLSYL